MTVTYMTVEQTLKVTEFLKISSNSIKRQDSSKEKMYSQFQDQSIDDEADTKVNADKSYNKAQSFDEQSDEQFKANYDAKVLQR